MSHCVTAPKSCLPAPARAAVEGSEEHPFAPKILLLGPLRKVCAGAARLVCWLAGWEMLIGRPAVCSAGPSATSTNAVHNCVGSLLELWLMFPAQKTSRGLRRK